VAVKAVLSGFWLFGVGYNRHKERKTFQGGEEMAFGRAECRCGYNNPCIYSKDREGLLMVAGKRHKIAQPNCQDLPDVYIWSTDPREAEFLGKAILPTGTIHFLK